MQIILVQRYCMNFHLFYGSYTVYQPCGITKEKNQFNLFCNMCMLFSNVFKNVVIF